MLQTALLHHPATIIRILVLPWTHPHQQVTPPLPPKYFHKENLALEVATLDLRDWGYNALFGNKFEDLPPKWQQLWELQPDPQDILDIDLWKEVMRGVGLTGSRFEVWEGPIEEKSDALLALLLPQLPNLTTLYAAMPENSPALLGMLDVCRKAGYPVLGKLETLFMMPSSQPKVT